MAWQLHQGDCIEVLRTLASESVDACVTDPPYHLQSGNASIDWSSFVTEKGETNKSGRGHKTGFMGKAWDGGDIAFRPEVWREVLRVLKPGGHLLAFSGTRTYHRMVCAIEDAGFEIRDQIGWLYGSGFPKSLDVSKAVRAALAKGRISRDEVANRHSGTEGWGTALKPAWEPIVLARKPLIGTVAENVLKHGTGGINVDGCRVGTEALPENIRGISKLGTFEGAEGNKTPARCGRWPANVIHDGSPEVLAGFQKSEVRGQKSEKGDLAADLCSLISSPQRFFYCAKASKKDRDESGPDGRIKNSHPTVKPTALMRYLCKLVTPPHGIVLDPFTGSGSTGKAALLEGFSFIGIERDPEYLNIAKARIKAAKKANTERRTPNVQRRMQNCLSAAR